MLFSFTLTNLPYSNISKLAKTLLFLLLSLWIWSVLIILLSVVFNICNTFKSNPPQINVWSFILKNDLIKETDEDVKSAYQIIIDNNQIKLEKLNKDIILLISKQINQK